MGSKRCFDVSSSIPFEEEAREECLREKKKKKRKKRKIGREEK